MSKVRKIELRVTKSELDRIRVKAQSKGYPTISSYIRSFTLKNDLLTEQNISETNKNVKRILEILEKK